MGEVGRQKTCEKKIKNAELKMTKIMSKINSLKLTNSYLTQVDVPVRNHNKKTSGKLKFFFSITAFLIFLYSVRWIHQLLSSQNCFLSIPAASKALFRTPEDCSMCVDVNDIVRLANVSQKDFEEFYAYGTFPVIVSDATIGWRAIEKFNFNFFKQFYQTSKMGKQINDCFFFAYKSGFKSLNEVLSMDDGRAELSGEPWYVGWSTCYDEETRRLRSYYDRPYFLPHTAESDMVDWIFMGGPGQGAHMHVDSVRHMSWQAQIRGRKHWQLAPPPECLYQCNWINFTVNPGDILVVDTNRWYHQTNVLPGDISITIGAEYD